MKRVLRYSYDDQVDLVKLLRTLDTKDAQWYLDLEAVTSPDLKRIFNNLRWDRNPNQAYAESSVSRESLEVLRSGKALPSQFSETFDLLPEGIKKFIKDLGELERLSKEEGVMPLIKAKMDEDGKPKIEQILTILHPSERPKVNFEGRYNSQLDGVNRLLNEQIYSPLQTRLTGIEGFVKGSRPMLMTWEGIRMNSERVNGILQALENVPKRYFITYFNIGFKPRDIGGREYYHWVYESQVNFGRDILANEVTFELDTKENDPAKKLAETFEEFKINMKLKKES